MAVQNPLLNQFEGGMMTSLPVFGGAFDGTELLEIVAPGNATSGVNYAITSLILTRLLAALTASPVIITSGASYPVLTTNTRVLWNKTVGSASAAVLGLAASQISGPVLFKDIKGDADVHPITITMTGGETADGLASVTINNPYGAIWFNPLAAGNWYLLQG